LKLDLLSHSHGPTCNSTFLRISKGRLETLPFCRPPNGNHEPLYFFALTRAALKLTRIRRPKGRPETLTCFRPPRGRLDTLPFFRPSKGRPETLCFSRSQGPTMKLFLCVALSRADLKLCMFSPSQGPTWKSTLFRSPPKGRPETTFFRSPKGRRETLPCFALLRGRPEALPLFAFPRALLKLYLFSPFQGQT
jgi:hypothetical protein